MNQESLGRIEQLDVEHKEKDTYETNEDLSKTVNERTKSTLESLSTDIVEEDFSNMESLAPLERTPEEFINLTKEALEDLAEIAGKLNKNIRVTVASSEGVLGDLKQEDKSNTETTSIKIHVCSKQDIARFFAHLGKLNDILDEDQIEMLDDPEPNEDVQRVINALAEELGGIIFVPNVKPILNKEDNDRRTSINLAERQFITITEPTVDLTDMKAATGNEEITELDPKEAKDLENALIKMRIRHEVLHALGVGKLFPEYLREGIVQKYTVKELNDIERYPGLAKAIYTKNIEAIESLENVLGDELGFEEEDIDKLFMSGDWEKYDEMYGYFVETEGFLSAEELFEREKTPDLFYQSILTK